MEEYSAEASIDVVQALSRALNIHRPLILRRRKIKDEYLKQARKKLDKLSKKDKSLSDLTDKAHEVLFKASTVFPFNLFPDTVTVDREKITIANRFFFRVAKINSVPIRDIQSIEADVGPFFGSIHMTSKYFVTNPRSVKYMWRNDVLHLQHLIQGYIIAHEEEVDCTNIQKKELVKMLVDLGSGAVD